MEKGLDALFDLTYDYDISLFNKDHRYQTLKQDHDFVVCYTRFLCLKTKYIKSFSDKFIQSNSNFFNVSEDAWHLYIDDGDHVAILQAATDEAFNNVREQIVKLAQNGNLKALAFCLKCDKNAINNIVFDKQINAIKNKQTKTPEEWEVLAMSHYFDCLDVRFDNMGQLFDKIWIASKRNYVACETQNQHVYEETMREMLFFARKLYESEFAQNYQKAMLGYYIQSFYGEDKLKNIADYLRLVKGGYDFIIENDVFSAYSDNKLYTAKDFQKTALNSKSLNNYNYGDKKKYSLDEAFKIFAGMFNEYDVKKVDDIYNNLAYAFVLLHSEDNFVTHDKKEIEKGYNILGQIAKRKLYGDDDKQQGLSNNLETALEMQ